MRRWLIGTILFALIALALTGCSGTSNGSAELETIGEGVSTEGRPVFYEFFTTG